MGRTLLVAGIIVLIAALAPTSANAVIPNSALVPTGPSTYTSSCTGSDGPTNMILSGVGVNPVLLPAVATTNAIDSPADGEQFTLAVTVTFTLPASLVAVAQSTGNTSLVETNTTLVVVATSGATGSSSQVDPGPTTINLPPASEPAVDVQFQQGPFNLTFTRSGTRTPVVLTPSAGSATSTLGAIALNLQCTAIDLTPLTLNDQEGPTPPPTTAAPVSTLPLTPTTAAAAPVVAASGTSQSTLARTGFHAELLYVGIAMLGIGYALSLGGRRVSRASARSR